MSCDICIRAPNSRLRFYCPTCACNQLYQLRVESARILLEKEVIGQQIENAVVPKSLQEISNKPEKHSDGQKDENSRHWAIRSITNKQAESSARTKILASQIEALKSEIKDKQLDISQRRLTLARQRSDAESARFQLTEREAAMLTGIQNSTKRTEHLWHSLHSKTAEARIFLCREAANLYGLRKRMKKKDGEYKETYVIGGVTITDLRDLNGATPAQISTSFSNIAHLLVLVSHYLSLRLPAEITLPHRNYPSATIYSPSGSYLSREASSKTSSSQSLPSSPIVSRPTDPRSHLPRPRPLSIDRSLLKLAKEDPGTYALFLEGVTLLAWNVSWLCRTQGLNLALDSWEEVCDLGKNMWQLLVAPPTEAATLMRAFAGRDIQSKMKVAKDSPKTTIQRTKSFPMLGHYSHGTVHSFLGASEGAEFMRSWKLPTPTKVVDKLKSTLLGEMASAEWEFLEKEWDDEPQESVKPPLQEHFIAPGPQTKRELPHEKNETNSTASANTRSTERSSNSPNPSNEAVSSSRPRGTSGWTKLRNR